MRDDMRSLISSNFLAFSLKAFATLNTGKEIPSDRYLELLSDRLAQVVTGETRRLVVNLPPRHYKTFIGTICLTAWILAHRPAAKVILLSYGQDLSEKNAFAVRAIIQSGWFQDTFQTRLAKNRTKLADFITQAGGGVRSLSVHGGVTGLGADFIIVDDPVQIKDCDNVRQLEYVNELFDNEIATRLDNPKKGGIVILAHRIAEDDLSGHVLDQGGWKHLKLPLIAPRRRTYQLANGKEWHRQKGELLRPGAYTRRDLEQRRSAKRPGFEALDQQNPGVRSLRIKPERFGRFTPHDLANANLPIVLSIDPAHKPGTGHSFTVIQAWQVADGSYRLLDQWREQAAYRDVRDAAFLFLRKYRPSVVLVEGSAMGPALCSDLPEQRGLEVISVTPCDAKVERVRKCLRVIHRGWVSLPDRASWRETFLAEAATFPYGESDQIDALSQFLNWIADNPTPLPRPPQALFAGCGSRGQQFEFSGRQADMVIGNLAACMRGRSRL